MTIEKLELEKGKYTRELNAYYKHLNEIEEDAKEYKTHIEFLEYMINKIEELEKEIKNGER